MSAARRPTVDPPTAAPDSPETGDPRLPRHPGRWLAFLRIVVGLWFLKSLVTKLEVVLVAGVVPVPAATERWVGFVPVRVGEWAEVNPVGWYREFLVEAVLPNPVLYGNLTALGESIVGLGLTLGFLTGYASLLGFILMANYLLASIGVPFTQQGFHILLIASMVAFGGARAGRTWGLDGWLARRFPTRFPGRIPLT